MVITYNMFSYLQDKISNFMEKRLNNNMVIYTKLNLLIQSQNKVFVSHYQQKIQITKIY